MEYPADGVHPSNLVAGQKTPEQTARLARMISMRRAGATWREIGEAEGISRQRASQAVKAYYRRYGDARS